MIRILDPKTGTHVDVAVSAHIVAAFELDATAGFGETFRERMRSTARRPGIDFRREALQFRDAISTFIDQRKEEYFRVTGRAQS